MALTEKQNAQVNKVVASITQGRPTKDPDRRLLEHGLLKDAAKLLDDMEGAPTYKDFMARFAALQKG